MEDIWDYFNTNKNTQEAIDNTHTGHWLSTFQVWYHWTSNIEGAQQPNKIVLIHKWDQFIAGCMAVLTD